MKTIYKLKEIKIEFYFKDGTIYSGQSFNGVYHYGDMPEYSYDVYDGSENEIWDKLLKECRYINDFYGNTTLFKKRRYLSYLYIHGVYFEERIYKDKLVKFSIERIYEDCSDNLPPISKLEKDLGFNDYTEFVFMRERQLKKLLLKGNF